mmetsp:Transcript_29299/g.56723  ORF Transcript_29299/g.56723 Transcript_29299/m.56723 type:complete len:100 (-) Transcript_29299:20-319(-)
MAALGAVVAAGEEASGGAAGHVGCPASVSGDWTELSAECRRFSADASASLSVTNGFEASDIVRHLKTLSASDGGCGAWLEARLPLLGGVVGSAESRSKR